MEISCWFQWSLDQSVSVLLSPYNYFLWLWSEQRSYWVLVTKKLKEQIEYKLLKILFWCWSLCADWKRYELCAFTVKKKRKSISVKCRTSHRSVQPDISGYISLDDNSNWILLVLMPSPLACPIEHNWQEQLQSSRPIDPVTWTCFSTSTFSDF